MEEEFLILLRAHLHRHLPAERIVGASGIFEITVGRHDSATAEEMDRTLEIDDTIGLDERYDRMGKLRTPTIEEAQTILDARQARELIHHSVKLEASPRSPSQSPLRHRLPQSEACTFPPHESNTRRLAPRTG